MKSATVEEGYMIWKQFNFLHVTVIILIFVNLDKYRKMSIIFPQRYAANFDSIFSFVLPLKPAFTEGAINGPLLCTLLHGPGLMVFSLCTVSSIGT